MTQQWANELWTRGSSNLLDFNPLSLNTQQQADWMQAATVEADAALARSEAHVAEWLNVGRQLAQFQTGAAVVSSNIAATATDWLMRQHARQAELLWFAQREAFAAGWYRGAVILLQKIHTSGTGASAWGGDDNAASTCANVGRAERSWRAT